MRLFILIILGCLYTDGGGKRIAQTNISPDITDGLLKVSRPYYHDVKSGRSIDVEENQLLAWLEDFSRDYPKQVRKSKKKDDPVLIWLKEYRTGNFKRIEVKEYLNWGSTWVFVPEDKLGAYLQRLKEFKKGRKEWEEELYQELAKRHDEGRYDKTDARFTFERYFSQFDDDGKHREEVVRMENERKIFTWAIDALRSGDIELAHNFLKRYPEGKGSTFLYKRMSNSIQDFEKKQEELRSAIESRERLKEENEKAASDDYHMKVQKLKPHLKKVLKSYNKEVIFSSIIQNYEEDFQFPFYTPGSLRGGFLNSDSIDLKNNDPQFVINELIKQMPDSYYEVVMEALGYVKESEEKTMRRYIQNFVKEGTKGSKQESLAMIEYYDFLEHSEKRKWKDVRRYFVHGLSLFNQQEDDIKIWERILRGRRYLLSDSDGSQNVKIYKKMVTGKKELLSFSTDGKTISRNRFTITIDQSEPGNNVIIIGY